MFVVFGNSTPSVAFILPYITSNSSCIAFGLTGALVDGFEG
jgi:hypothetical protein